MRGSSSGQTTDAYPDSVSKTLYNAETKIQEYDAQPMFLDKDKRYRILRQTFRNCPPSLRNTLNDASVHVPWIRERHTQPRRLHVYTRYMTRTTTIRGRTMTPYYHLQRWLLVAARAPEKAKVNARAHAKIRTTLRLVCLKRTKHRSSKRVLTQTRHTS